MSKMSVELALALVARAPFSMNKSTKCERGDLFE